MDCLKQPNVMLSIGHKQSQNTCVHHLPLSRDTSVESVQVTVDLIHFWVDLIHFAGKTQNLHDQSTGCGNCYSEEDSLHEAACMISSSGHQ